MFCFRFKLRPVGGFDIGGLETLLGGIAKEFLDEDDFGILTDLSARGPVPNLTNELGALGLALYLLTASGEY